MLRSLNELKGYRIEGTDDDIGKVHDFFFDDRAWAVRYVVVDTRRWLPGRKVLVVPPVLRKPNWESRVFPVSLTKEQIQKSPSMDEDQPVSRQKEEELHTYFGWVPYWHYQGTMPHEAVMLHDSGATADEREMRFPGEPRSGTGTEAEQGDPHLRSAEEVTGYHIGATDGEIGHVEDFLVDDEDWTLRYIVVDTRNLLPGKKVLVAPGWIDSVEWSDARVKVGLTREAIKQSPPYKPSEPVNREYEVRLYDYYGRPFYWK